jgi:hypothetical protein
VLLALGLEVGDDLKLVDCLLHRAIDLQVNLTELLSVEGRYQVQPVQRLNELDLGKRFKADLRPVLLEVGPNHIQSFLECFGDLRSVVNGPVRKLDLLAESLELGDVVAEFTELEFALVGVRHRHKVHIAIVQSESQVSYNIPEVLVGARILPGS